MATDSARTGSTTNPALHCVEVSGLRLGLEVLRTLSWVSTQRASSSAISAAGQPGSTTALAVLPNAFGLCRSHSDGARKPLPAEARTRSCGIACQRPDTRGLVFEPTSL